MHLGMKVVGYSVSDAGVKLDFEDGTSDTGDFLVIADVSLITLHTPDTDPNGHW